MLPPPAPVVTVVQDLGGEIDKFDRRITKYRHRGTRVRIMGECTSACTMVLRLGSRVCIGPHATFGFHQAFTFADPAHPAESDVFNRNDVGTAILWSSYPAPVRAWLADRGGLTATLVYLHGDELRAMLPSCR